MIVGSGLVEISLVESEIGHTDLHTVCVCSAGF